MGRKNERERERDRESERETYEGGEQTVKEQQVDSQLHRVRLKD